VRPHAYSVLKVLLALASAGGPDSLAPILSKH
jgi:hypothetical protein